MNEPGEMFEAASGTRPRTIRELLDDVRSRLRFAGIPNCGLDARVLVGSVLGMGREKLIMLSGDAVDPDSVDRARALADERIQRVPVSRILGTREFWSRDFALSAGTLDPRPDSETLVAATLERLKKRDTDGLRILDLGVGSGCLLVTLLCETPGSEGIGIDLDSGAVGTARVNAQAHDVGHRALFACGNWAEALSGKFDLIISNPPYICSEDIDALEPEVALHDPRLALDGGLDGLDAYRRIATLAGPLLAENGCVCLELGDGQVASVSSILSDAGFVVESVNRDLSGISRCVCATPIVN